MNDQSKLLIQSQLLKNQPQILNQPQPLMNMNQPPLLMSNQPPQMLNSQSQMMKNQSQMLVRSYGNWPQPVTAPRSDLGQFMNPSNPKNPKFGQSKVGRSNWKGKKGIDKRKGGARKEKPVIPDLGVGSGPSGYKPPNLNELQRQNRLKARRFYMNKNSNRFAPYAPRNTTSFIIRAKKSGGIASLVSPCPVTPAVLPTPIFSPSREVLVDMAKEEWGVDGYGSMKGLIRLRSPGHEHEDDEEDEGGSSESDVEEHVEVERRLDHDLSRFEMIYPNYGANSNNYNNLLENRVDDQDTHIAQLEEENLVLKERLFLMEREFVEMRRRLQYIEMGRRVGGDHNEEIVENVSENGSDARDGHDMDDNDVSLELEYVSGERGNRSVEQDNRVGDEKEDNNEQSEHKVVGADVCMGEFAKEEVSKERGLSGDEFASEGYLNERRLDEGETKGVLKTQRMEEIVAEDVSKKHRADGFSSKGVLIERIVAESEVKNGSVMEDGSEDCKAEGETENHSVVRVVEDGSDDCEVEKETVNHSVVEYIDQRVAEDGSNASQVAQKESMDDVMMVESRT